MMTTRWKLMSWVASAVFVAACNDNPPTGPGPTADVPADIAADVPEDVATDTVTPPDQTPPVDVPEDVVTDTVVPPDEPTPDVPADVPEDVPADVSRCLTGQIECLGTCIDPTTNMSNCGTCGNACAGGSTCVMGVCACGMGQTLCGMGSAAACVDLQSNNTACGACGTTCATGQSCRAGVCVADCASPRTLCGTGSTAVCTDTQTDAANCGGCGTACETGQVCTAGRCGCAMGQLSCTGVCVDGQTSNTNCGDCGNACVGGSTCQTGRCTCASGQLCGTGASATCIDTQSNNMNCGACGNVCGTGQTCRAGRCECPTGQTACDMGTVICVDLTSSATHCGTCGNACAAGLVCTAGACVCPAGQTNCGGTCVNTATSNANCGACGAACGTAQTCAGGACTCPAGQTVCGTACVDARTDNANCGRCGVTCTGGQTCMAGACNCPVGQTLCGGTCVDTRANNGNCGACGTVCPAGQTCQAGACNCPAGLTFCAGACVDTRSNSGNCGRCGTVCSVTTTCTAGACVAGAPSNDTPAGAITIDVSAPTANLLTNTTNARNSVSGPCGCTAGNDVFYRFTLTRPEIVYADTVGSSWDASLFLQTASNVNITDPGMPGGQTCNDDGGFGCAIGVQAQIAAYLPAGTYFLVLSGCGAGETTVHFQHLPASNPNLRFGMTAPSTTTTANTLLGASNLTSACCSTGPEITYWGVTCPEFAGGPLNATANSNGQVNATLDQRSANRGATAACVAASTCGATTAITTTIPAGAGLHTLVVDSCGAGGPFNLAVTVGTCTSGQTLCAGACTATATDAANCGACGTVCTGGRTCTASTCACPAGTTFCGGACIPVTTDVNNCGGCGIRCGADQTCARATCVNAVTGLSFRIDSLTATGCSAIEHNTITGDDRGGIAVSNTNVFYTGDGATGRFSLTDLSGATNVGRQYDALVSDLRSGKVYTFATSATTPMLYGGGTATHLIEIDGATGALTTNAIALSAAIALPSGTGFFSGYERLGVHNASHFFHISMPSGRVLDLGVMPTPSHSGCESWAYWGTLEYFGGGLYVDYVASGPYPYTTIARMSAPAGTVTTLGTFTNLSDMCTFTIQPWRNRWYFHFEGASQFRSGDETIGYCNATWSSPSDTFQIRTMSNTSCVSTDHATVTGDDRGGIVVSSTNAFYTGDSATGRFNAADLRAGAALSTSPTQVDTFVQNVRTGSIYALAGTGGVLPYGGGTVTALAELDGNTGALTGRTITLSQAISVGSGSGLFSGWDRVVILNGAHAFDISLRSGSVVDMGLMPIPTHVGCESWAFWGTAEFYGNQLYVDMVSNTNTIARVAVPSGVTTTLASFPNDSLGRLGLSDMCSFTFSPMRNRWFWHHEGNSTLRGNASCFVDETIGSCAGAFANP